MTLSHEDRKTIIRMAQRKARPGAGSGRHILRERTAEYGGTDVRALLGKIPFAIAGGLATRLYMPERMKLTSGRMQDLADVSRMLGCADTSDVNGVRETIKRYRPQDAEDLESLLVLGKLEHEEP